MPKNPSEHSMPHCMGKSLVRSVIVFYTIFRPDFEYNFSVCGVYAENDFVPTITERVEVGEVFGYEGFKRPLSDNCTVFRP